MKRTLSHPYVKPSPKCGSSPNTRCSPLRIAVIHFSPRDLIVVLAYGRVYREVDLLLREAKRAKLKAILITDTLAVPLRGRVELVLPVARGRADMFSMHTATLALVEALLVGVAAKLPKQTLESLERLDALRHELTEVTGNVPRLRRP